MITNSMQFEKSIHLQYLHIYHFVRRNKFHLPKHFAKMPLRMRYYKYKRWEILWPTYLTNSTVLRQPPTAVQLRLQPLIQIH